MRWPLLLLCLLCIPFIAADEGWYYAGDSFTKDGVLYTVEGISHTQVLLSVGSRSYFISLGECMKEGLAEYCYLQSAYPSDDAHIKYAVGERYYGYKIGIVTIKPSLTITRKASITSPKLGDKITIDVELKNNGDYPIQFFTYTEAIPEGMKIVSGNSEFGNIVYETKSLSSDEVKKFSYSLQAIDYVNANIAPNITYKYEGQPFNASATALAFFVETPLVVTRSIASKINLGETATYNLTVANKDDEEAMAVKVSLQLPSGLHQTKLVGFTAAGNNTYVAELELEPETNQTLNMHIYGAVSGTFKIPVDIVASVHDNEFKRHYEESITAKADKLSPSIKLSSNRPAYAPGETLTIAGLLENLNDGVTFKTINGKLSAPGLFEDVKFSHEAFPPKKTLTEAETTIVMPAVEESKQFTITFKGQYATPAGELFDFEASKSITASPIKEVISVTRIVDPSLPRRGTNITVRVSGKNLFGQYATFSASESYDPELVRVSGLTYTDESLDRDAQAELYLYQLEIPANYSKSSFNLTTSILVKGEPTPVKTTTVVYLDAVPQEAAKNETAAVPTGTDEAEVEKKEGFFTRTWKFLKGLF
jgi:uncharacterized repeat protein (TIGR01451 family)